MTLLLIAFIAGILTVLAPCVLPLLPIIVGGSLAGATRRRQPLIIILALILSVVFFTLLIKFSSALIGVPQIFWQIVSGLIIVGVGISLVWPRLWAKFPGVAKWSSGSDQFLNQSAQYRGVWGDILIGAALGPVFSSCSPTYFIILATILPQSLASGVVYLLVYALGLGLMLWLIALLGQRLIRNLGWLADPRGIVRRTIGVLFVIVGLAIIGGWDKKLETVLIVNGHWDLSAWENNLLAKVLPEAGNLNGLTSGEMLTLADKAKRYQQYHELVEPDGFVNTGGRPIKLADYIGKQIILLDVMTYSCINCQRSLPYVESWYQKYGQSGLMVIGIHTPEFAFEKDLANVTKAMGELGVTFPIVLDNSYGTWNAYGNHYWPHKYLIDIDGYLVYDHIGEGGYDEIEKEIVSLLAERATRLKLSAPLANSAPPMGVIAIDQSKVQSPETYFGAARNEYLANGKVSQTGEQVLTLPSQLAGNSLYLAGDWQFADDWATSWRAGNKIIFRYNAKNVYLVAGADAPVRLKITRDGQPLGAATGADVDADGFVTVGENKLYKLINGTDYGAHELEIEIEGTGGKFFTLTFG